MKGSNNIIKHNKVIKSLEIRRECVKDKMSFKQAVKIKMFGVLQRHKQT
jgi:hypothetical protein